MADDAAEAAESTPAPWVSVPSELLQQRARFLATGFVVSPAAVLSAEAVAACRRHLADVLAMKYDRGVPPTKAPRYELERLDKNDKRRKITLQVINIRHCDSAFQRLVHDPELGRLAATLAGWGGARVAQDQVWCKPAGAAALAFHRDTPYFPFVPNDIVTVWITFDDLDGPNATQLGPLEYYPGSHRWQDTGREGIATQFFDKNYRDHLRIAAGREPSGVYDEHAIVAVRTPAGGLSVHDGKTWHGSGPNASDRARRGIGIHFARAEVTFQPGWLPPQWAAVREAAIARAAREEAAGDTSAPVVPSSATDVARLTSLVPESECPVTFVVRMEADANDTSG